MTRIKHLVQLKAALGIAGVETTESTWFHQARGPEEQRARIDLLIDPTRGTIPSHPVRLLRPVRPGLELEGRS